MSRHLRARLATLEADHSARHGHLEVWYRDASRSNTLAASPRQVTYRNVTAPEEVASELDLAHRVIGNPGAALIIEGWPMNAAETKKRAHMLTHTTRETAT